MERKIRVLVAKPGLDGHSNGAEQIASRARDIGFAVSYDGIRLTPAEIEGGTLTVRTPVDGTEIARLKTHNTADIQAMIAKGVKAFESWRQVPAPRRGERSLAGSYSESIDACPFAHSLPRLTG